MRGDYRNRAGLSKTSLLIFAGLENSPPIHIRFPLPALSVKLPASNHSPYKQSTANHPEGEDHAKVLS
jgi:hypothetical protein